MAALLCQSNINFTSSSWKVIDATSASLVETTWNWVSTSYVSSLNFTPGAITVEGLMVKVAYVSGVLGTFSVELYNATSAASVAGTEVTVNLSDLPQQNNIASITNGGCVYLKFNTPVTLLAATSYNLRTKTSIANTILLNISSGNNWSRGLVTSTSGTPASTDKLYICGFYTNLSSGTTSTCTYNNISSTVWGSIEVGAHGKMILQNSASTNYVMKIATGGFYINGLNAITEFGDSSNPLVSTSTFLLELQCSSAGSNGIENRNLATFTSYGESKIRTAKLAANSSVGATSLTTNVSTGWKSGDEISFASTVRSGSVQIERKALTANASGTTLTITAMTLAKLGTGDYPCDIGNMTSNIKIYGTSATLSFYLRNNISSGGLGRIDFDNIEFRYFGSGTSDRFGFNCYGSIGCLNRFYNCSFADGHSSGYGIMFIQGNIEHFDIQNNIFYIVNRGVSFWTDLTIKTGTKKINNNLFINSSMEIGGGSTLIGEYYEVKNNIINAITTGMNINISDNITGIDGILIYGCFSTGGNISINRSTIKNIKSYISNSIGLTMANCRDSIFDTFECYGTTSYNFFVNSSSISNLRLVNFNIQAGPAGLVCPRGIVLQGSCDGLYIDNSFIGTVTQHASGDITLLNTAAGKVVCRNTTLGSVTQFSSQANMGNFDILSLQRSAGSAGIHRSYKQFGRLDSDTIIYDMIKSLRMIPSSATYKLCSSIFQTSVSSGSTATISIKVRKSVVGDGTAYNGNQPRLILISNPSAGSAYNNDIVCATASGAAGSWETLSYTLPSAVTDNIGLEFYIDCDGTTGWVNVDTFVSNNNNSMTYFMNGEPISDVVSSDVVSSEKSFTFVG